MSDVIAGHYVAGVLGASLLRHWYRDGASNAERTAELRLVLDVIDQEPLSAALNPRRADLRAGYADWSETYDGPNPLISAEDPVVRPWFDQLTQPGVQALDAGCGTGRHAAALVERGAEVLGVDQSPEMLAVARAQVPTATFVEGDLERLPAESDRFDLAVASLTLCHLPDPTTAVAELGRVLRPGGTLVITDPHPASALVGGQAFFGAIEPGALQWVENHYHGAATWLPAFAAADLDVVEVREEPFTDEQIMTSPASAAFPDAMRSLLVGVPSFWLWVLRRR